MGIFSYIKQNGLKKAIRVLCQYKIDLAVQKLILPFVSNKPLKDTIIIESHNDFDCNGGAFYKYLLDNKYNKKYKIIWLLKHPENKPKKLPANVECYSLFLPSIKKDYHICTARFFLADCFITVKKRSNQTSIFMGHGTGGLKNVKGICNVNPSVDYVLIQSPRYAPIQAVQYGLEKAPEKMIFIGYPVHDLLHENDNSELRKISDKHYKKTVLWMPTFRKAQSGGGYKRSDSEKEQKLGIPLLNSFDEYNELNTFLNEQDVLLIIKLHPMQDLTDFGLEDQSNIRILTGESVKQRGIDNYRLMRCVDALISDYSGVAYDFLQMDKPIAYVLDDMQEYKLGFVVEDIHTLLAGHEIYTISDFRSFILDVSDENDKYKDKRYQISNYIYEYHDNYNCERLAEFLKL